MESSTTHLVLAPDAAIDLQMHTTYSDGTWTPEQLIDYLVYDGPLLDQLRQEVRIDGIEVYYPAYTPQQIAMYLEYAHKHSLLTSSGSDSHGPGRKPIKYRAELSRNLLERVGIQLR